MKKLLLASAVAALSITAANAAPQVYGKAFLTLDVNEGDTDTITRVGGVSTKTSVSADDRSQLNSNASRIGFKGSEALTANTDLVYQLEYRVDIDDDTRDFEARDTYLGLSNKQYGTLLAGRLTAIDSMVDYANVTVGGVLGGDNVLATIDGPRANNAFAYVSPNYNGVNFLGMYILDENRDTDTLNGDAWGVGVQYEPANQPFRAGATYIKASNGASNSVTTTTTTTNTVNNPVYDTAGTLIGTTPITNTNTSTTTTVNYDELQAIRVSGAYDLNPATTVGALYQNTKFGKSAKKENAFTLSAEHKLVQTPWTAYGQLDFVDNVGGSKDSEAFRAVVGSKYAFNKATTGHIYGAYLKTEGYDNYVDADNYVKQEFDAFGIGAGLEYKF